MLGLFSEDEKRRAFEILDQVGLADFAYARTDQLSGGQEQRVGIARALVQDPLLMLADEPIASLDPKSSRTVMEHLRWAADELGVACLANLHQVDFAMEFSDRIMALKKGRVVFDGAPHLLDEAAIADRPARTRSRSRKRRRTAFTGRRYRLSNARGGSERLRKSGGEGFLLAGGWR